jgi:hypothetical protein
MAETLRFRLVVFGSPATPAAVYPVFERPDGLVLLRDKEFSWPMERSLDAITVEDVAELYPDVPIRILAPQEVTAADRPAAYDKMWSAVKALYETGVPEREVVSLS